MSAGALCRCQPVRVSSQQVDAPVYLRRSASHPDTGVRRDRIQHHQECAWSLGRARVGIRATEAERVLNGQGCAGTAALIPSALYQVRAILLATAGPRSRARRRVWPAPPRRGRSARRIPRSAASAWCPRRRSALFSASAGAPLRARDCGSRIRARPVPDHRSRAARAVPAIAAPSPPGAG
jgi:hypothetical protein